MSKHIVKTQWTILKVYHHECTHLPVLPANHTQLFGRVIVVSNGHARAEPPPPPPNRRLVIKFRMRHATSYEREKPQAGERFKQRCGRQQRVLSSALGTGVSI